MTGTLLVGLPDELQELSRDGTLTRDARQLISAAASRLRYLEGLVDRANQAFTRETQRRITMQNLIDAVTTEMDSAQHAVDNNDDLAVTLCDLLDGYDILCREHDQPSHR